MKFNIDSLPFILINKKVVLRSKLQADAERIFVCLSTEDAQKYMELFSGKARSRFKADQYKFVKMAYWHNLPNQPKKRILDLGGATWNVAYGVQELRP